MLRLLERFPSATDDALIFFDPKQGIEDNDQRTYTRAAFGAVSAALDGVMVGLWIPTNQSERAIATRRAF